MNICLVPFDGANPYQRQLADALRQLGVRVTARRSLRGLVARICVGADKTDVVHLHWLPRAEFAGLAGLRLLAFLVRVRLLRMLGCRIVWTVHNLRHHEATSRRCERWLAKRVIANASRVIVHSKTAVSLTAEEFGLRDCRKLTVVPHGSYVRAYPNTVESGDARARLDVDPEAVVFLFFGNIRPYKGAAELIAAYRRVETCASVLMVVGQASNATRLEIEQLAADAMRIQVRTDFVPDEEVQYYMNASDVVVFPYRDVLTSGAVILAMSFGRACIAPAIGCIPDILDERGAFLYDPKDPNGLSAALGKAVSCREHLREMGAHNLERARDWGWDRVARETADVYVVALRDTSH